MRFKPQSVKKPIAVAAAPSPHCPPPKHKPITVTSHSVAAVVTPWTSPSLRNIAPPPMKPTPVRMPSGRRIRSRVIVWPSWFWVATSRMLAWIIATAAATQTSKVVRKPAGCS